MKDISGLEIQAFLKYLVSICFAVNQSSYTYLLNAVGLSKVFT